jgi:hypothetical protein
VELRIRPRLNVPAFDLVEQYPQAVAFAFGFDEAVAARNQKLEIREFWRRLIAHWGGVVQEPRNFFDFFKPSLS